MRLNKFDKRSKFLIKFVESHDVCDVPDYKVIVDEEYQLCGFLLTFANNIFFHLQYVGRNFLSYLYI